MEKNIYCISGLGADEKIFRNLQIPGYRLIHIPWLIPEKKEKISAYAGRMAQFIHHENPIVIGVSFGGMMGIEIAKQRTLNQLFIISSIKTSRELPAWMKWSGSLHLNKLLPVKSFRITEKADNRRLGVTNDAEKAMVSGYRKSANTRYVNWAINQVVNWKNNWYPPGLVHIHGDEDRMFPVKKIDAHHILKGGTHLMIWNRTGEIARIISGEIRS